MKRIALALLNLIQWNFYAYWVVACVALGFVITLLTLRREAALIVSRAVFAPVALWVARVRVRLDPLPDIDWSKPHIFLMNHNSSADIPVAFACLPVSLRFVAKHSLRWVPFMGWYMWLTGMVFIDRSNRVQAVHSLQRAGRQIREGANIIAFPEGTRSRDGRMLPFKKGVFVLALEAGVPIVPVVAEGTRHRMPPGSLRIFPGEVHVRVGRPIPTAGRDHASREELIREVRREMVRMYTELGGPGAIGQDIAAAATPGESAELPA